MEEIFTQYLDRLIELKIYPFIPLEVNFMINLCWVILRSAFRAVSDYRVSKLEIDKSPTINIFTFLEFKILVFILSFLVMFMLALSLDFWFTYLELKPTHILWWLPSVAAIILAETSNLLAGIFRGKGVEEEEEIGFEKSRQGLSIYFIISSLFLVFFWAFMIFKTL